jgi:hypothetical protein
MSDASAGAGIEEQLVPGISGAGSDANAERASLLDQLGQVRQEIKEQAEPLFLDIPGYKERLWVKFRPFSISKTESKVRKMQKANSKGRPILLAGACDTLIDACEQVMLLPEKFEGEIGEEGKNLIPIDDITPVGFDQRLAELFKVPGAAQLSQARQVVMAMFPTEQSILRMSVTVSEWLNGELNEETDEAFLGNSEGTTR